MTRLRIGFLSAVVFIQVLIFSHDVVDASTHSPYTFDDLLGYVAKAGQELRYGDVQVILKKLHFENCNVTTRKLDCNRCLSPNGLGLSSLSVLNSTYFAAKSLEIVYFLLPEPTSGHQGNTTCQGTPSLPRKLFETLVHNFTDGRSTGITEHALEHILTDVNKTLGPHLTKKKCFSAESIIAEVTKDASPHSHQHASNATGLDEDDFQKACAIVVYRLIQGYCITNHEEHSKLPSPSFFIDELFKDKSYLKEEDLEVITKKLGIAKEDQTNAASDSHGHNHKRRRRAVAEPTMAPTPHNVTCFSLDSLLDIFSIDHSVGASKSSFKELCPGLIQQMQSGSCTKKTTKKTTSSINAAQVWGYGFLSVTIISLASLLGVATIPFVGKAMYKKVLALMVALAVGSLAGDATLHLIPHAFGLHEHKEGVDSHSEDVSKNFLWKAAVVLASIYVFYLFEVLMHFGLKNKHTHSHVDLELPGPSSRHMSYKKKKACSNYEHHEGMPQSLGDSDEKVPETNGDIVLTNVNAKTEDGSDSAPRKPTLNKKISSLKQSLSRRSVFTDDHQHDKDKTEGISTVAWMIIIGDTIHNISDGLAIGAAFSEGGSSGLSGGISTSIAVFCHELPHELGDFAVLLSAGMSIKKALLANFLSACSCYIGLVIGILIGQEMEFRLWIFAIAGGMFLYVALVDMLPDLMHSESLQTDTLVTFLLQNIGLLLGITIMLLIAYFEEALMSAVSIA